MTSGEAFQKWFQLFNAELEKLGMNKIDAQSAAAAWNAANSWSDGNLFDDEDEK
nr:MAG: hypothetical protein [Bacteriophage sp.]